MKRRIAAFRSAWSRYWAAYDELAALTAHHAMGHVCSFCRPSR